MIRENLGLNIFSVFSGIGGLELGLERSGLGAVVGQSEINKFCSSVLAHHWPSVKNWGDIKNVTGENVPHFDILCGGFPCQSVSVAGKGLVEEDQRWLWPQFYRVINEYKPEWVVIENVAGLRTRGLGIILGGLAESGYDAEWARVSAAAVGAPHLRERYFIVAYSNNQRDNNIAGDRERDSRVSLDPNSDTEGRESIRKYEKREPPLENEKRGREEKTNVGDDIDRFRSSMAEARIFTREARSSLPYDPQGTNWSSEPDLCRMAYGVPRRLDKLTALGNAVVPQCAQFVGECIYDAIIG